MSLAGNYAGLEPELASSVVHESVDTESGFTKKKLPFGTYLAAAWMVLLLICVLFAAWLPLPDPNESFPGLKEVAPFQVSGHPLGSDGNGRDMLARVVYGARARWRSAVAAVLFGLVIGGTLGLVSGYFRGKIGNALVSLFDILLAFPPLVLALALVAVLRGDPSKDEGLPTILILVLALGIVSIPVLARITRANTLAWSNGTSSRGTGARSARTHGSSSGRSSRT